MEVGDLDCPENQLQTLEGKESFISVFFSLKGRGRERERRGWERWSKKRKAEGGARREGAGTYNFP